MAWLFISIFGINIEQQNNRGKPFIREKSDFFVGCSPPLHALKLGDNRLVRIEGDVHIWEIVVSFQACKNDGVVCGIRTKLVGDLEGHLAVA